MSRKLARELAFQGLYQLDITKEPAKQVIKNILEENELKDIDYFTTIITGVEDKKSSIDEAIQKYTKKWKVERLSKVDKAILRLATYEMQYKEDVPNIVAINEAVELAKNFSNAESPKFINGVLDELRKEMEEGK